MKSPKKTGKKNPFGKFIKEKPDRKTRRKKLQGKPAKKKTPQSNSSDSKAPVGQKIRTPNYDSQRLKKLEKRAIPKDTAEKGIRLNRFVANAGVCSRREADELIFTGKIQVNDKVCQKPSYRVQPKDEVKYQNKVLRREKFVYVLLNKPKDHITTTNDPQGRKTVMNLVRQACDERVFPVGRLDRNTTGVLLLTNDGDLAKKLAHPSSQIIKEYQAELDKPVTEEDAEKIQAGFELEDGFIQPDDFYFFGDGRIVGLKLHSGKNRIVRRIFEHLGYEVLKLDRTGFGGLTKKTVLRGKWRYLTEKEVIHLKYMKK